MAILSAFGHKLDLEMEGIKHLYRSLEKGYNSMPINLPGTPFRKAMKVKRDPISIIITHLSNIYDDVLNFKRVFLNPLVSMTARYQ